MLIELSKYMIPTMEGSTGGITFSVKPIKSVNNIKFGSSRDAVRKVFGSDYKEFKKTKLSRNTTDAYASFHVYYTPNNKFTAIEIFNNTNITISGKEFSWDYSDAKKLLLSIDSSATIDEDDATSVKYSIGIHSSDGKVKSVLFGAQNYYN